MLPSFGATHGICLGCQIEHPLMKHKFPDVIELLKDGGWFRVPAAGYWPVYMRERNGIVDMVTRHDGEKTNGMVGWQLERCGEVVCYGSLSEVLEYV